MLHQLSTQSFQALTTVPSGMHVMQMQYCLLAGGSTQASQMY
ncbi:hypothetical protein [Rubritalea tangerina]